MKVQKILFVLFISSLFFTVLVCSDRDEKKPREKKSVNKLEENKTNLNFFIENSASMDGYVKGITEFEQNIYSYLVDLSNSGLFNSINLFYTNDSVIPQGNDIRNFVDNLEPDIFRQRGGNRRITNISNMLTSILEKTDTNTISIFVTDGIFSPGRGRSANEYLLNQQINIRSSFLNHLSKYPKTSVIIYYMLSQFNGYYYDAFDRPIRLRQQRPFYIYVIGEYKLLKNLINKVPNPGLRDRTVQNFLSITPQINVRYSIIPGTGKFQLEKNNRSTIIRNLEPLISNGNRIYRFSINVDFSDLLLNDAYLMDTSNYEINNNEFRFNIIRNNPVWTSRIYNITFHSTRPYRGEINLKLKYNIPNWVREINDEIGLQPDSSRTFGFLYQIKGIYEAYNTRSQYITEIKITIN